MNDEKDNVELKSEKKEYLTSTKKIILNIIMFKQWFYYA